MMPSFSSNCGRKSLYLQMPVDTGCLCAHCMEESPCTSCSSLLALHGYFFFASYNCRNIIGCVRKMTTKKGNRGYGETITSIWELYSSEFISNGRHNSGSVIWFPQSSWSGRILQLGVASSVKKYFCLAISNGCKVSCNSLTCCCLSSIPLSCKRRRKRKKGTKQWENYCQQKHAKKDKKILCDQK